MLTRNQEVGAVFRALAHDKRRRLLAELVERGPLTASELARGVGTTRQGVIKHMDILSRARLVERRRIGGRVLFSANAGALIPGVAWMFELGCTAARRGDVTDGR